MACLEGRNFTTKLYPLEESESMQCGFEVKSKNALVSKKIPQLQGQLGGVFRHVCFLRSRPLIPIAA